MNLTTRRTSSEAYHFSPIEDFLEQNTRDSKNPFDSILHMENIKDLIYDIYAWAELWYVHQGKDIYDIISSRSNSAAMIIARDPDINDSHITAKDGIDSTKAFRSYFITDYDAYKIAKINACSILRLAGRNDLGTDICHMSIRYHHQT